MWQYASPCSEYPTTCAKTGSPVEQMNITFVPGGKHGSAVKFLLPRVQGIQVAMPHNTVTKRNNTVSRNNIFVLTK